MKVKTIFTGGVIGCWLMLAAPAWAQPPANQPGPPPGEPRPEKARNIESIKLWRMTQALDLSEEQTAKIFPNLHKLQKERRKFRQAHRQMMQELTALIQNPQLPENLLLKKVEQIEKAEKTFRDFERKSQEQIKDQLTPLQQAKLILFEEKFERDLRQIFRELREQKGTSAPRRHPPKTPPEPQE